jgi:3-oxoacyl-[acyl-carrier protein] reductase
LVCGADITDSNSLTSILDQITQCDILVNCAGKTQQINHSDLASLTDDLFDSMMVSNLRGTFATIRTLLPLLKLSSEGVIVNIGSSSAQGNGGSNLAYSAAKAGLECLTRKLAPAIAPVRILTVCPDGLDTNFVTRSQGFVDHMTKTTPLGRIGTVDDIADATMACITGMRFATGQSFIIDGGRGA